MSTKLEVACPVVDTSESKVCLNTLDLNKKLVAALYVHLSWFLTGS
jgi:hypothetical protein